MNFCLEKILVEINRADDEVADAFKDDVHRQRDRVSKHAFDSLRVFVAYLCKGIYFVDNDYQEDFISEKKEKEAVHYCRNKCVQLGTLYDYLNNTFMHVSINGDESVRLYFAFRDLIYDVQRFAEAYFSIHFLKPFDDYPENMDDTLKRYYLSVGESFGKEPTSRFDDGVFYVERQKPIIVGGHRLFYELTMIPVGDTDNKFGRMVVFSKTKVKTNYAVKASLVLSSLRFAGNDVPVTLIEDWEVSIRPCELEKIAFFSGINVKVLRKNKDYQNLMILLKKTDLSLTDICSCCEKEFQQYKNEISPAAPAGVILRILEACRSIIESRACGHRTVRYLLYRTNYDILNKVSPNPDDRLFDGTMLPKSCYPFETLPFARSLPNHNPSLFDLLQSQPDEDYRSQFVYRYLREQLTVNGRMYVPKEEMESVFPDFEELISKYNAVAYYPKTIISSHFDKYYIVESEETLLNIFVILKSFLDGGYSDYQSLKKQNEGIFSANISADKIAALANMFSVSRLSLIYGPAGSGKTTLLSALSIIFKDKASLFLANTYAALNNMKAQISKNGSLSNKTFSSIASFIHGAHERNYDVVFVDECSTVANEDFLSFLHLINSKAIILVGDPQQIEAIKFGNWFSIAQQVLPTSVQTNLSEIFRADKGSPLLKLWGDLRNDKFRDAKIDLADGHNSRPLDEALFRRDSDDEIILALNYDGVYGVNNLNNILQAGNIKGKSFVWRQRLYKIGDPIIFTATSLFSEEIYNNLKGKIVNIVPEDNRITFSVMIRSPGLAVGPHVGFECLSCNADGDAVISFVRDKPSQEYFDAGGDNRYSIPFQTAYAVSIHKAQGLEYDSVKVVVTEEAGEYVTKNILYTAITRAKRDLLLFWSPEVQEHVLSNIKPKSNADYSILIASNLL